METQITTTVSTYRLGISFQTDSSPHHKEQKDFRFFPLPPSFPEEDAQKEWLGINSIDK